MNTKQLKKNKLRVLKDFVAFTWVKHKLKSQIIIPDSHYAKGLEVGKFYVGKVLAIGPKVWQVKCKDKILIQEYGIKDYRGEWKEEEIYFIEDNYIKAIVNNVNDYIERTLRG